MASAPPAGAIQALVLALVLALSAPAPARAETVRLASLDWPPFSGAGLARQGAVTAVIQEAFRAAGDTVSVTFLPWRRAVETGLNAPGFIGYFPEYYSRGMEERCLYSRPLGRSPIGFAERRSAPVAWTSVADLRGLTVGTVQGYINEAEFDRLAAAGEIRADAAVDDATNLRKVAAGHLALAVIDRNVMAFLLASDPALRKAGAALQFNARPLEEKELFVCFRRDAAGTAAHARFEAALDGIDVQAILAESLALPKR